jgi:hypothetical protein
LQGTCACAILFKPRTNNKGTFFLCLGAPSNKPKNSEFQLNYLKSFDNFKAVDGKALKDQMDDYKTIYIAQLVGIKNLKLTRKALKKSCKFMNRLI